jgi:putative transposase
VSEVGPQEAFRDLERAVRNWRIARSGFPRLKAKKNWDDNKACLTGVIRVFSRHVQLPRIGKVRTKEPTGKLLRLLAAGKARILSATVAREADRWFVSLSCEGERPDPTPRRGEPVGLDLGLTSLLVSSDGTRVERPKALGLLQRRCRQLSRKQNGSKSYRKAALRLARLQRRVRNIRRDFLHHVTTWLAKTKSVLVVEDLKVRSLGRGRLSRCVADASWSTFRRMLEYKCAWHGATVVAPRDFPCTRRCSRCGWVAPKLALWRRVFQCESCGLELDRDWNAARNLRRYGLASLRSPTGSSPGSDAGGDGLGGGTDAESVRSTSNPSKKPEVARHLFAVGGRSK